MLQVVLIWGAERAGRAVVVIKRARSGVVKGAIVMWFVGLFERRDLGSIHRCHGHVLSCIWAFRHEACVEIFKAASIFDASSPMPSRCGEMPLLHYIGPGSNGGLPAAE